VCSDPAVVEAYRRDPLVFDGVTSRWVTEMLRATRRVQRHAARYQVPLAVHYGEADRIVSIAAIQRFCARYGGPIDCKAWPGLYHEILNEPCRERVLRELVDRVSAFRGP